MLDVARILIRALRLHHPLPHSQYWFTHIGFLGFRVLGFGV